MTAGGSVTFDPEMAADPHVCSFIRQIWQEGQGLEPEASATELGKLKKNDFVVVVSFHVYAVSFLCTYI